MAIIYHVASYTEGTEDLSEWPCLLVYLLYHQQKESASGVGPESHLSHDSLAQNLAQKNQWLAFLPPNLSPEHKSTWMCNRYFKFIVSKFKSSSPVFFPSSTLSLSHIHRKAPSRPPHLNKQKQSSDNFSVHTLLSFFHAMPNPSTQAI